MSAKGSHVAVEASRVMHFTVPGQPVPWQRAGTRDGRHYTKPQTREWQEALRWSFVQASPHHEPHDGPVTLDVTAYLSAPQRLRGKKHAAGILLESVPMTTRPDVDNIAVKAVLDALSGLAYTDDARVWQVTARKVYSMRPRLEVVITFGTG